MSELNTAGGPAGPQDVAEGFAQELAEWRIGCCPGTGFAENLIARVRQTAKDKRIGFATLWGEVHRLAYIKIDQGFRRGRMK